MDNGKLIVDRDEARRWTGRLLMAVILGLAIWNLVVSVIENVVVPGLGALMGQDGSLPASFTKNYDYPDLFVAVLKFCVAGIVAVSINWFFQRERKQRVRVVESVPVSPRPVIAPEPVPVRQTPPVVEAPVVRTPPPAPAVPARVVANTPPVVPVAATPAPSTIVRPAPMPAPNVPVAVPKPVPAPVAASVAAKPEAPVLAKPVAPPAAPVQAQPVPAKAEDKKPKKEKQVYYNLVGEPVEVDED
jgi:large-conductance mechanosensitive channel